MRLRLGLRPVFRQIDVVHQFSQPAMITGVEIEGQSRQVAELCFVVFFAAVDMLMEVVAEAQVGKCHLHVFERRVTECVVHANQELTLEPAAGVEVAVELVDLLHRLIDVIDRRISFRSVGRM